MRAARVSQRYWSLRNLVTTLRQPRTVLEIQLQHLLEDHAHGLLLLDHEALQALLERAPNADVVLLLRLVGCSGHLSLLQRVAMLVALRRIDELLIALPPPGKLLYFGLPRHHLACSFRTRFARAAAAART